ncbi:MAG: DUF2341 domain-containing protein [Spirochaetes bacterium]|nr:DUF2341 domain-containing protein [Spirochaetota bacterium]
MYIYKITSSRIVYCLFILLSIVLVRCSDGIDVLMQPDRSLIAFAHGNIGSADLSNLELSSGDLTPEFQPAVITYTSDIDNTVPSITVTPTSVEEEAVILVNGVQVVSGQASGPIVMNYGENQITVDVTSYDGLLTRTYYLTVLRCNLDNAYLSNLELSSGTLEPEFAAGTDSYIAYVDITVPSITVTPTAEEPYSTIRVNGTVVLSGEQSPGIALSPGENIIDVAVLSYDGTVGRTYTVTIYQSDIANADLSNLAMSTGSFNESFSPNTLNYTSNIHETVSSLRVTPTAVDPYARISVAGLSVFSGQPSSLIGLITGFNPSIDTVVTSADGSVSKTYSIVINRFDFFSYILSGLVVTDQAASAVVYNPAFDPGQTAYSANIDTSVTAVRVTPSAVAGVITVNGSVVSSGSASDLINMNHGVNTITVTVTNGLNSQTYTVTLTRFDPDNANLSNLSISNGTLSPVFNENTTSYTANVSTSSITVTPTLSESYSSVEVNGIPVNSGQPSASIPINIGNNIITITVTSFDGTINTYTITATRAAVLTADFISARSIRLDTTSSGAGVSGTVTNFPVLIRLTDSAIIDAVRPDVDDIRFTVSGGSTWLDYEVERWDQANNLAEVWVLVPEVAGNSNTYITMYYNDAVDGAVANGQNHAAVFSAANGFAAVYHMNNNPAGGTGAIMDSSSNGLHGTASGMNSSDLVTGQIGQSLDFDGSGDEINLGTSGLLQPANLTVSFWVDKTSDLLGFFQYQNFICAKSSRTGNGWYIDFSPGLAVGLGAVPLEFYVDGNNNGWVITPTLLSLDWLFPAEWVQITISFNTTNNSCEMYRNGEAISKNEVGSPSSITATTGAKTIAGGDFNLNLDATMDEIRISSVVRSADWVKLEYENQRTNQSLVKF